MYHHHFLGRRFRFYFPCRSLTRRETVSAAFIRTSIQSFRLIYTSDTRSLATCIISAIPLFPAHTQFSSPNDVVDIYYDLSRATILRRVAIIFPRLPLIPIIRPAPAFILLYLFVTCSQLHTFAVYFCPSSPSLRPCQQTQRIVAAFVNLDRQ